MILSYRDERTRDFAQGKRIKAFSSIDRAARLKLDRLEAATSTMDLAGLPGNRLKPLKENGKGNTAYESMINGECVLNGLTNRKDRQTLKLLIITKWENFSCQ